MGDTTFIALLAVIFILLMVVVPPLLVRRAIPSVIRLFRQHNAVGSRNAKAIHELGLKPRTMIERMLKGVDYRPAALQLLIKAGVIQITEDGKLYLSEENLASTKWKGR